MHVFAIAAISANGCIGPDVTTTSTDWTSEEDKQFFRDRTKEAKVMVMGSTTFETVGRVLKDRLIIVLSSKPKPDKYAHLDDSQVRYTTLQPQQLIEELKGQGFEEVAICGGSSVYSQFLQAELIQTVYLTIEPIIFAGGVPLFKEGGTHRLSLVSEKKIGAQTLLLEYTVI